MRSVGLYLQLLPLAHARHVEHIIMRASLLRLKTIIVIEIRRMHRCRLDVRVQLRIHGGDLGQVHLNSQQAAQ